MVIYDRILSDPMSSSNDSFKPLTKLVTTLVRHFAVAADRNPLLYVEGLFCVGNRFRKYCEMVTNVYLDEVSDELGMRGNFARYSATLVAPV